MAFLENQSRMPSRSFLAIPAATPISGALERMAQEARARVSKRAVKRGLGLAPQGMRAVRVFDSL
ncbi:hypothetical protein [Olsenella sp. Marseille-P4559]|uniref:hypothetical protein n=1 Tax=Olsenella sp. Marseille-P4559 TaxID=2364795 RepID=UPI001F5FA9C6|nr:hypothetical protein [Olsenella sp. Marseille-P4559]